MGDATGNNNFGYYFGGQTVSTVQRVNYSNDTATASPKGPLSAAKYMAAATGNTSHGYYAGGGPGPYKTSIDRVDYSNDTVTASPRGVLNIGNRSLSGMSAREYGLPIIGSTVSEFTNIVTRQYLPSSQRGYFGGGNNPTVLSQTQRIEFSNDTVTATIRGNLTINASSADKQSGTGNVNYGYFAGTNPSVTNVDRIDYANDMTIALKSNVLINAVNRIGAVANNDYGYFAGGTPGPKSTVSRLDFSNDDGGGVAKGNLSLARYGLTGVGNQNFGYMTGGLSKSTVDRIDYANDTATAPARGPLASARYAHAATGNASYGYVAGGYPENVTGTTIQRIDYASDTSTSSPKGTLSESKYYLAGTGNIDYGYIGGGRESNDPGQPNITSTSKIERIDFSNDTAAALPKGSLALAFREGGAVSGGANALPQFGG